MLENDFFLPAVFGFALFGILGGLPWSPGGSCRSGWAGCCSPSGIVALVPPIAWFAMLATELWVLVAGIWLVVQGPPAIEQAEPVAAGERVLA